MSDLSKREREQLVTILTAHFERSFAENQRVHTRALELMEMSGLDLTGIRPEDSRFAESFPIAVALAEASADFVLGETDRQGAIVKAMDAAVDGLAWQQEFSGESPDPEEVAASRRALAEMAEMLFQYLLPESGVEYLRGVIHMARAISLEQACEPQDVFIEEDLFREFMRRTSTRHELKASGEAMKEMLSGEGVGEEFIRAMIVMARAKAEAEGHSLTQEDEDEIRNIFSGELPGDVQTALAAQRTAIDMVIAEDAMRFFGPQD